MRPAVPRSVSELFVSPPPEQPLANGPSVEEYREMMKGRTHLDLHYENLQGEDMEYLCHALEGNDTLQWLGLGGNRLGPVGARHLAQALKNNNSITELQVKH